MMPRSGEFFNEGGAKAGHVGKICGQASLCEHRSGKTKICDRSKVQIKARCFESAGMT